MRTVSGSISVLLVDDQRPFLAAARAVVAVTEGFHVVGEATSGEEAVAAAARLHPDLVLMDINMDGTSGIVATRRILEDRPQTAVILLSTYDQNDLPADARTCGALAYVHKEQFGPDVLERVWESRSEGCPLSGCG
jgi:DNA-binding NarL/FixJ family response regulator